MWLKALSLNGETVWLAQQSVEGIPSRDIPHIAMGQLMRRADGLPVDAGVVINNGETPPAPKSKPPGIPVPPKVAPITQENVPDLEYEPQGVVPITGDTLVVGKDSMLITGVDSNYVYGDGITLSRNSITTGEYKIKKRTQLVLPLLSKLMAEVTDLVYCEDPKCKRIGKLLTCKGNDYELLTGYNITKAFSPTRYVALSDNFEPLGTRPVAGDWVKCISPQANFPYSEWCYVTDVGKNYVEVKATPKTSDSFDKYLFNSVNRIFLRTWRAHV